MVLMGQMMRRSLLVFLNHYLILSRSLLSATDRGFGWKNGQEVFEGNSVPWGLSERRRAFNLTGNGLSADHENQLSMKGLKPATATFQAKKSLYRKSRCDFNAGSIGS